MVIVKIKLKIFLFLWQPMFVLAQQSNLNDLKLQLANTENDSARYKIFGKLSNFYIEKKIDSALFFMEQCLVLAQKNRKRLNEASSLNDKGLCLRHMGRYSEALQCYLRGFEIAQDAKSEKDFWPLSRWVFAPDKTARSSRLIVLGSLHMQMANLFIRTGSNDLCIYHFAEAEKLGKETQSYYFLYYLYATMGIAYKNLNKLDSASLIVQNGLSLSKQFGYKENVSRLLAYIGEIQFARGSIDTAAKYYHEALRLAFEENNFVSLVMIYFGLTKCFMTQQEKDSSLYYAHKAMETLNKVGSLAGTVWNPAMAYENLFRIYKMRKETDSTEKYLELALRAKDSLNTYAIKSSAQAQDLFLREQIRMKELEKERIQFRNKVRAYVMLAGIGVLLLLSIIFYRNIRQKQKAKAKIEKAYNEVERQKEKSDELLLNILPYEVAEELKEKGYTTAKAFEEVTVLFCDIKGFTNVAENMTAQELVKEINTYFSAFDNTIQKYGLEKIKTIGDAYIAAGGLPEKNSATAQNVIEAAIAMQQAVEKLKQERELSNKPYFELRIGIHTGPVVAGVVGIKKFQYDIWGDTVNLAARMEQSGVPGKINISQHTYELVKEQFTCVHRGKIEAKNKGEIDMYFVE
jgi:class 3 adenylate cyclase/tetratricopeptide (TPR) repeat protein